MARSLTPIPQYSASADIWNEFVVAAEKRSDRGFDWLLGQGVRRRTLFCGPEFAAEDLIVTFRDGTFQPHELGERAFITPVCRHYDWRRDDFEIADLCAWRPSQPGRMWLRHGAFPLLNLEAVERTQHFGDPLYLYQTVLDWLIADCQGIVIFDWSCVPFWLAGVPEIRVDCLPLVRRLERSLRLGRDEPRIMVADGVAEHVE